MAHEPQKGSDKLIGEINKLRQRIGKSDRAWIELHAAISQVLRTNEIPISDKLLDQLVLAVRDELTGHNSVVQPNPNA